MIYPTCPELPLPLSVVEARATAACPVELTQELCTKLDTHSKCLAAVALGLVCFFMTVTFVITCQTLPEIVSVIPVLSAQVFLFEPLVGLKSLSSVSRSSRAFKSNVLLLSFVKEEGVEERRERGQVEEILSQIPWSCHTF